MRVSLAHARLGRAWGARQAATALAKLQGYDLQGKKIKARDPPHPNPRGEGGERSRFPWRGEGAKPAGVPGRERAEELLPVSDRGRGRGDVRPRTRERVRV